MLASSPSMYCTTTAVNSSRKAKWKWPSFMVAGGREREREREGGREGGREGESGRILKT